MPHLEITEVLLMRCNIADNDYIVNTLLTTNMLLIHSNIVDNDY